MLWAWGMFGDFHIWCSGMVEVSFLFLFVVNIFIYFIVVIKRAGNVRYCIILDGTVLNNKWVCWLSMFFHRLFIYYYYIIHIIPDEKFGRWPVLFILLLFFFANFIVSLLKNAVLLSFYRITNYLGIFNSFIHIISKSISDVKTCQIVIIVL